MKNESSDSNTVDRLLPEDDYEDKYRDESEAAYFNKYLNLLKSKEEYEKRHIESHEDIVRLKKLEKYMVKPHQKLTIEMRQELAEIISSAKDEKPIQKFIGKHPFLITSKVQPAHHLQVCIPTPNLGGLFKPDFLIAGMDSAGFWWYGVELENPNYHMFTQAGDQTKELSHALRQIEDWREWLTDNIMYAQHTLGYIQIDAELPSYVLIGRRDEEVLEASNLQNRQRAVMKRDKNQLLLHHYEWLLDDSLTLVRVK